MNHTARPVLAWLSAMALCLALLAAPFVNASEDAGFEERARRYLESVPADAKGGFGAVARISSGRPADLAGLSGELLHIESRLDCSDFRIAALLRLMYLHGDSELLSDAARAEVLDTILGFKYWIDEPGKDSMCYWSENHQILYHSAEYLAGARYPDRVFPNSGMTGREHMEKGKHLCERWLSWREKYGFSEWFSNVYYEEDLYALLNLADFAPDPEMRTRAAMAVDQLALNMALNQHKGNFTVTHGRSYMNNVLSPRGDRVKEVFYLWWGVREFTADMRGVSGGGVAAATSTYRPPPAILKIGADHSLVYENYQSHGLAMELAPEHGFDYNDKAAGMFFWGQGMYTHPLAADVTASMWRDYDLYENSFFLGLSRIGVALAKRGKLDDFFRKYNVASSGAYLADTHTYTYRTPDYVVSAALDHRKGEIDAQALVWQAGLGGDAVVFTNYPAKVLGDRPSYWAGNASDPRAAQHKNVVVLIYDAKRKKAIGELKRFKYTHAWFPKDAFDRVEVRGQWTFGKKGGGYIGLYSRNDASYVKRGEYAGREIIARGMNNVWIAELGRAEESGTFDDFMDALSSARVDAGDLAVSYESPSLGLVEFSWDGPFMVDGNEEPLRRDYRYDNPFVRARRYSDRLEIEAGGETLVLDFANNRRIIGSEGR